MGEHVVPGRVLTRCGHVIGDDVEHDPHPARRQLPVQRLEVGLGAELGVEPPRVHHVVAMRAARRARSMGEQWMWLMPRQLR